MPGEGVQAFRRLVTLATRAGVFDEFRAAYFRLRKLGHDPMVAGEKAWAEVRPTKVTVVAPGKEGTA